MTRKLYYEDCHLDRFRARVTDCRETEKGYEVIELGKGFRAWEAAGKKIAYPKKK